MMDLDNDIDVNKLEVAAWVRRNEYVICRPLRDKVLGDLQKQTLKTYHPLFIFLDADSNKVINKTDVSTLVRKLDTNNDFMISHKNFKDATDKMFAKICKEEAYNDREAFLTRSQQKQSSKKDLFSLMDTNSDGKLTRKELVYIYRTIDVNRDIRDSHQEVVDWVRKNLDSICASERTQIIKKIKKEDD